MKKVIVLCLFLCGCGVYTGSEGIKYLGDTLTGFRTPTVDAQIEADRKKAYENGVKDKELGKADVLDDGSVTIFTSEEVLEAGGSVLSSIIPYGGAAGGILLMIIGFFRKRKKAK